MWYGREEKLKAPTYMQGVFVYKGVTFLPHYEKPGLFVGPGYNKISSTAPAAQKFPVNDRTYTASDLIQMGAQPQVRPLLARVGMVEKNT